MARAHVMTPARRAALRKAQRASAQARRKHGATQQHSPSPTGPSVTIRVTTHHPHPATPARRRPTRRQITRAATVVGAVATTGAVVYSQAHSPRSYTRTAVSRRHYARAHAAMHYSLAQANYATSAKTKINRGQHVAPFPIKATRRTTRQNARIMAAANFPKGAVYKPKNVMRVTTVRVKAQKVRKRSKRSRRR